MIYCFCLWCSKFIVDDCVLFIFILVHVKHEINTKCYKILLENILCCKLNCQIYLIILNPISQV